MLKNFPDPILDIENVVSISSCSFHTLALKEDGTVWGWGCNFGGQLGIDIYDEAISIPIQIPNINNGVKVSAGCFHSTVLLSNKKMVTLGNNDYGQLGDGTLESRHLPLEVQNLGNIYKISAGGTHTIALGCGNVLGDLNENGTITSFDVTLLLQDIINLTNLSNKQRCAADVNENGIITSMDASYILQCVIGVCNNLPENFYQVCQNQGNCL